MSQAIPAIVTEQPLSEHDIRPEDDDLNVDTEEDRQVEEAVIVQKPDPNQFDSETDEDEDEVPHEEDLDYGAIDDANLDNADKELMAITERNRYIEYEKPTDENKKTNAADKYRPDVLVCQKPEVVRSDDRIITTIRYGYVDKASMAEILPGPQRRVRTYLIMCDFSDESYHAMEWAMGTMLRNNDELHILTVVNREEEFGSDEDVRKELEKASKLSTSKAKNTIEKMLLYNIRITTHVVYGKIKDTLLTMVSNVRMCRTENLRVLFIHHVL
ncbi:hypothetical protein BC943DRAFT_276138 [Umbelopsis sp. AD052]|nr:hypothetical protein BC943DRAFT_276138 [Umbelopsis sp. AD052]